MTETVILDKIRNDIQNRINSYDALLEYKYTLSGIGFGASVSDMHDANTKKKECQRIIGMIQRFTGA
jgi:hypothetical protein